MTACALGAGIADGAIDPVALTEHFLDRIETRDGEHRVYLHVTATRARAEAKAAARRAHDGLRRGPLDGVPISWKDLFDSAGAPTTAASPIFAGRVPDADAALLARAGRAGLVCLGKTNLTEFAFSGLGINPHYGTPANAFDDECARVPGGSSSGAAVSVARGLAPAAIGSDTGGSVRIPAAWNGLVGLKTTAGLLPMAGVIPLAASLDTAGPLTRDVADANAVFAVLAARAPADLTGATLAGQRLIVPSNVVWDGIEPGNEQTVRAAIERLATAGAEVVWEEVPELAEVGALFARDGPMVAAEAYARWRDVVESHADEIYHNVLKRFRAGAEVTAVGFERMRRGLDRLAARLHARREVQHLGAAAIVRQEHHQIPSEWVVAGRPGDKIVIDANRFAALARHGGQHDNLVVASVIRHGRRFGAEDVLDDRHMNRRVERPRLRYEPGEGLTIHGLKHAFVEDGHAGRSARAVEGASCFAHNQLDHPLVIRSSGKAQEEPTIAVRVVDDVGNLAVNRNIGVDRHGGNDVVGSEGVAIGHHEPVARSRTVEGQVSSGASDALGQILDTGNAVDGEPAEESLERRRQCVAEQFMQQRAEIRLARLKRVVIEAPQLLLQESQEQTIGIDRESLSVGGLKDGQRRSHEVGVVNEVGQT
ncbi:MAG: hypothetical protein IID39_02495 [Planctomycetes bacterium]|nr:hypothetical protein [Planctomycetota bacterium]